VSSAPSSSREKARHSPPGSVADREEKDSAAHESVWPIGVIDSRSSVLSRCLQADIKEMVNKTFYEMYTRDKIAPWEIMSRCKIPIIAAVNGVAFGGGCEIAMMADIILAAENAKFGQPEIKLGESMSR
jgi:hypothetical protein